MNIVVLISGNGSNLQAIIDACKTNKIKGTVRAVFSNKADAFGLERARQAGIATHTLIASAFDSREAYDRELIHEIDMYAPDVVVLAGFMRILSPAFVSHYAGRLLNIHPSLLPKYPGLHTHRQALENGDERMRCNTRLAGAFKAERVGLIAENCPYGAFNGWMVNVCRRRATLPTSNAP